MRAPSAPDSCARMSFAVRLAKAFAAATVVFFAIAAGLPALALLVGTVAVVAVLTVCVVIAFVDPRPLEATLRFLERTPGPSFPDADSSPAWFQLLTALALLAALVTFVGVFSPSSRVGRFIDLLVANTWRKL